MAVGVAVAVMTGAEIMFTEVVVAVRAVQGEPEAVSVYTPLAVGVMVPGLRTPEVYPPGPAHEYVIEPAAPVEEPESEKVPPGQTLEADAVAVSEEGITLTTCVILPCEPQQPPPEEL